MDTPSWDDLRVLLAVHRSGSLLAAGKSLGLSTSTTGRRLDALEAALGLRLVNRSRAGTELEPAAHRLVRLAEELEHGLAAERRDRKAQGRTIKISVPDGSVLAATHALLAFRRDHPDTELELIGENRMCDLAKREADLGLRLTRSTSQVLVERHVVTLRFGIYASREYVRRYLPSARLSARDAARHSFVGLDRRWLSLPHEAWMRSLGAVRFPFRSSSILAILEAVRQGVGMAALVEQDAKNHDLVRIDVTSTGPTQPLYLAYHRELRKDPHLRGVVRALEAYVARHF